MGMNIIELKDEILKGKCIKRNNTNSIEVIMKAEINQLLECANEIRRFFCGDKGNLCTIINGKSGRCSENCKFCAQSAFNNTNADIYEFIEEDKLLSAYKKSCEKGIDRFSVVTAGKNLKGEEFERACHAFKKMNKDCNTQICASFGLLEFKDFVKLKESGVNRIHANIETSKEYFKNICTTHSFEDKLNCIKAAQRAGLEVCSGGIIGLGEGFKDRISMAFTLNEIGIRSIPINVLMPIKGTKLENNKALSEEDILRSFALFRFINPKAEIRFAAGRGLFKDRGRKAFLGGLNAAITGDMLTTTGTGVDEDIMIFKELGLKK